MIAGIVRCLLLAALAMPAAVLPFPARGNAQSPERTVTSRDQKGAALTVYEGDLALVRDGRQVALRRGDNRLAWQDVSTKILPETVLLRDPGHPAGFGVIEQNFDFDLLTPQRLLKKYVGRSVQVARTNPATGEERLVTARVLAVDGGVVLKIGDRIETGLPGRLIYPDIPPDLRERPTLALLVHSAADGPQRLELSYLTKGLSWKADYAAELNPEENRMQLTCWATLTNRSGIDYRGARVQVVAGKVHQAASKRPVPLLYGAARTEAAAPPAAEKSFFEYHLYTLARPVTLKDDQSKQVALMEAKDIPVGREYLLRGSDVYYSRSFAHPIGNPGVGVLLEFRNDAKSGLGRPLPAGMFRVYRRERGGNALFVGGDRIDHTPLGGEVKVRLGEAFDVTAERRQTDFKTIGGGGSSARVFESAYRIVLKNAKGKAVTVKVEEPIPGDWEMVEENHPHEKKAAHLALWRLSVPAHGQATLTYRVRVKL